VASGGVYGRLLSAARCEHDRCGVDPRWLRQHRGDDERPTPPHEVCCGRPEWHEDLEAGRPVVLTACELARVAELTPPPTSPDPRWFEVSVDDRIVEVPEPQWAR
jgi:hypothetical protein